MRQIFPADTICHRVVAATQPPFSERERIQLFVAGLMLSEGFADSKLDEMWYKSCQGFKRASLPCPHCRPKGTYQQQLSSVGLLLTGGVAIGARLDHPCLDLEWCVHSTLLIQTSTMQSLVGGNYLVFDQI